MLEEVRSIKEQAVKDLEPVEEELEEAIIATEKKYFVDFCEKHKERLKDISDKANVQIHQLNKRIGELLEYKKSTSKEEFKNKLAIAILLLEQHLKENNPIHREAIMLKNLGNENILIANLANSLLNNQNMLKGIETTEEINKEFHKAIHKARRGVYACQNKGPAKFFLTLITHKLFKSYRFPFKEVINDGNTLLVDNLKRLDRLERLIKQKRYEDAWSEIEGLEVKVLVI